MLKSEFWKPGLQAVLAAALELVGQAFGGEAYYTGFETPPFAIGDDKIIGTDGWVGSSHVGLKLSGIMDETSHQLIGLGNAAYLGGYSTSIASTNKTVFLRRPVNLDPVALNQEVATFSVSCGIKDSSSASLFRRDNFEFLIYNQASQLLGGVQFDNTTLDTSSGLPQGVIWRLAWSGTAFQYYNTGFKFLPQTMETLQFRINYRTNRWTVTLGGVPLFQDLAFYTGTSYAKNLGSVIAQMRVTNNAPFSTNIYPGDNYLLFDDFAVRTDPVTTTPNVSKTNGGAATINWNEEASYSYRLQYSSDCKTWLDFAGSIHTATVTGDTRFTDPTSPVPTRRFYRVKRTYP